jgi:hypothetical protein
MCKEGRWLKSFHPRVNCCVLSDSNFFSLIRCFVHCHIWRHFKQWNLAYKQILLYRLCSRFGLYCPITSLIDIQTILASFLLQYTAQYILDIVCNKI